jgi:4-hydroxybenzoate polyprenyltransferase
MTPVLFFGILGFATLPIPLLAVGVFRMLKREGPVKLLGQVQIGAGIIALIGAVLYFSGILPNAFLLMSFAISFGLGAYMLSAIMDKSPDRRIDWVMWIWLAMVVTAVAVRAI